MRHSFVAMFAVLLLGPKALAQDVPILSNQAKISLLTIGPGEALYSSFGHSAIWVSDPVLGIDRVYNYGTFDSFTDNFYLKFLRGTLPYQLSVGTFEQHFDFYKNRENRTITENQIDLTPYQKQKLLGLLEENYKPQNRQYKYRFYYDNCSTRIRDMFLKTYGDSVNYSPVEELRNKSYRTWMNQYLEDRPWSHLAMNIAIGEPADEGASQQESAYLPENLKKLFRNARSFTNGHIRIILGPDKVLYQAKPAENNIPFFLAPSWVFGAFLLFVLFRTYRNWKTHYCGYRFDKVFLGIIGLVGWILLLLWIATDHGVTNNNLNLLWAFPLHLPLIFFMHEYRRPKWHWMYFLATAILLAVGMVTCEHHILGLLPIIGAIAVRCLFHVSIERFRKHTMKKKMSL
jgi:hypothetical protein